MFPAQGHIEMDIYGLPWFFPADADADADVDTDVDADVDADAYTDPNLDAQDYERYKITSFFLTIPHCGQESEPVSI